MSDEGKGPLDKRGKGLEDEWIRRKEAEEAKSQRGRKSGGNPQDGDEESHDGARDAGSHSESDSNGKIIVAIIVVVVAALLLAVLL